jgi:ABC-type Zn uptake system ZnuABC Zn-binding protein ZnuA
VGIRGLGSARFGGGIAGLAIAATLSLGLSGCSGSNGTTQAMAAGSSGARLRVVTTVSPITSIVASVGGDLVQINGLIPEGADSHTFEPPPSAAVTLSQADVVFVNGLKLEDPTKDLARENLRSGAEIVDLGRGTVTPKQYIYDFSFPRDGGKPNPHLWTNPPFAKRYGRIVADTLSRRDPRHRARYEANYATFAQQVDELDRAMTTATASLPPRQRQLLTYHDAYAYFGKHYGWTIIGAIQVSNFEDPTPKEVAGLIAQVRAKGVKAIFGSEVFPSSVLAAIGKEAHVRYVDELRDDDLPGAPGDPLHSWLGLMRFDFITMVSSLGGDASALRAISVDASADRAEYPQ